MTSNKDFLDHRDHEVVVGDLVCYNLSGEIAIGDEGKSFIADCLVVRGQLPHLPFPSPFRFARSRNFLPFTCIQGWFGWSGLASVLASTFPSAPIHTESRRESARHNRSPCSLA